MPAEFYAFGEFLWDCLPSGRHAGGAAFNVAAHLAQIGVSSALISSVGQDEPGDQLLAVAQKRGVNVDLVTRARIGLATGASLITLDQNGDATFDVVEPAAWDEITFPLEALEEVAQARALVYGSIVARSPNNREQLNRLLDVKGPIKFFDVNLRPPFSSPPRVLELATRADVLKLNDQELQLLSSWLAGGVASDDAPPDEHTIRRACETLAGATNVRRICVTRGAQGAALWEDGTLITVPVPRVEVRDTVGAGDAFMAGVMVGLTNGREPRKVLEDACKLGAYVASQDGATPFLPDELTGPIRQG